LANYVSFKNYLWYSRSRRIDKSMVFKYLKRRNILCVSPFIYDYSSPNEIPIALAALTNSPLGSTCFC